MGRPRVQLQSLRMRFIAAGIVPTVLLVVGLFVMTSIALHHLRRMHEREVRNTGELLARASAYYIDLAMQTHLETMIRALLESATIDRIEIRRRGQTFVVQQREQVRFSEESLQKHLQKLRDTSVPMAELDTPAGRYLVYRVPVVVQRASTATEAALLGGGRTQSREEVIGDITLYFPLRTYSRVRQFMVFLGIGLILGFAGISGVQAYRFSNVIIRRILNVLHGATSVAEGSLAVQVEENQRQDELARLGQAFNRMVLRLRELLQENKRAVEAVRDVADHLQTNAQQVRSVNEQAQTAFQTVEQSVENVLAMMDSVHQSIHDLSGSIDEAATSILEINASAEEMAQQVDRLTESISTGVAAVEQMIAAIREVDANIDRLFQLIVETTSSLREMEASITEVAKSSEEFVRLSEQVTGNARHGIDAMETMTQVMDVIQAAVEDAWNVVNQLSRRSSEMAMIVSVIDDVADQTNLLALNAAIIAAQAGEQGKSFAVVAEEIRELADRTAQSTSEIAQLIEQTQSDITMTVKGIQRGRERVQQGVELAQTARQAMTQIVDSAEAVRNGSREVARATEEQSRTIQMINQVMNQIHDLGQHVSRASHQLRTGSQQIHTAIEQIREMGEVAQRATQEQTQGTRLIHRSIQMVQRKLENITHAADETRANMGQIRKALLGLHRAQRKSAEQSQALEQLVTTLNSLSERLHEHMAYFTL